MENTGYAMMRFHLYVPLMAVIVLSGCGGGETETLSRDTTGTGRFVLEVTDAPLDDAAKVVLSYSGVEIKPVEGSVISFDFEESKSIDLIEVTRNGIPAELLSESIPEGDYSWFRIKVDAQTDGNPDSYIKLRSGATHELHIPSGSESGLKVNAPFTMVRNSGYGFLVDFDLRKSIVEAGGEYFLKPVLRSVAYSSANLLAVEIAPEVIADQCGLVGTPSGALDYAGAVYLFTGHDVEPDDVDGPADERPVMTVPVYYSDSEDPDLENQYEAYFARFWSIPEVEYTVAYTCNPNDHPEQDDPDVIFADQTLNLDRNLLSDDNNVIVKLEF
ncbi:DUF4382 domain-containing protein [Hahella ganghwensis]|uniref:DUF4382 domain-containing protein n=1 Tax=Hahella ganghwensis TaxID=286420 RepID=UPI0003A3C608|nr:DUF4382 domain-containing protein [Hahella ganghwensis]